MVLFNGSGNSRAGLVREFLFCFGKNVKFRQISFTTGVKFAIIFLTGCGSAWLEHLIWDQEVAGSNPVTQTFCADHKEPTRKNEDLGGVFS